MANTPIIKKRDGCNSVAIFKQEYTNKHGEVKPRYSVAVQHSYTDKNKEWQESSLSCHSEDLLAFSSLLEQAYIDLTKYIEDTK